MPLKILWIFLLCSIGIVQGMENVRIGVKQYTGYEIWQEDGKTIVRKNKTEDCYDYCNFTHNDKNGMFAIVCDGHCGKNVSSFVTQKFYQFFINNLKASNEIEIALNNAFKNCHDALEKNYEKYLNEGSTGLVCVIYGGNCFFGNLGDSRGYLKTQNGSVFTRDHKPDNPEMLKYYNEKCRQDTDFNNRYGTESGDFVRDNRIELGRGLNVSHTFGDFFYKYYKDKRMQTPGVLEKPTITKTKIEDGSYVIVATDGFWDEIDNEKEVNDLVKQGDEKEKDEKEMADSLAFWAADGKRINATARELYHAQNQDDVTVMFMRYHEDHTDSKSHKIIGTLCLLSVLIMMYYKCMK